ncbi:hypothetical protein [Ancylobacter radicis]|uniref:DUF2794 domain-containing protein n=1 Tax=Ancylobacter radicis TaxID=2836179 RepID=A0ABS5R4I8_9HYPH|nr:hypothetical protein [Ancylobacter radicis]MBS9476546.1 hypothetical protein [Ancylobacter radicis]
MAEKLTMHEMLATASHLPRLPFDPRELAAIRGASPIIGAKLSPKFEPEDGYCYLASSQLHMEFVVVKSVRKKTLFGSLKPRYTIFMGFDNGEVWEQGPQVTTTRAVAFVFQRLQAADRWLDSEYGRKR